MLMRITKKVFGKRLVNTYGDEGIFIPFDIQYDKINGVEYAYGVSLNKKGEVITYITPTARNGQGIGDHWKLYRPSRKKK